MQINSINLIFFLIFLCLQMVSFGFIWNTGMQFTSTVEWIFICIVQIVINLYSLYFEGLFIVAHTIQFPTSTFWLFKSILILHLHDRWVIGSSRMFIWQYWPFYSCWIFFFIAVINHWTLIIFNNIFKTLQIYKCLEILIFYHILKYLNIHFILKIFVFWMTLN